MSETVNAIGLDSRWTLVQAIAPVVLQDATPVLSGGINTSLYKDSRCMLFTSVKETTDTAHYITWTVTESATEGGSYTAVTTSGTLSALAASGCQVASFRKSVTKPWIKVTMTGSHADLDQIATAFVAFIDD